MNKKKTPAIKRAYKDTLFRHLFSYSKENALSLYNAVNGTAYTDVNELVFTTLEDTIYMTYKNDNAFLFEGMLNLYEHQSTINSNMPLRGFIYHARMYEGLIQDDAVLYSYKLYKIPTPKYIVFYNGVDYIEDVVKLKLSDAFERPDDSGEFEWTATVLNINKGHNEGIVQACSILSGYSTLIGMIRDYQKTYPLKEAIELAIDECIRGGVLSEYLTKCRNEAISMVFTTFDKEKYEQRMKEDYMELGYEKGVEDGLERGIEQGLVQGLEQGIEQGIEQSIAAIATLIKAGKINALEAAEALGVSVERIKQYLQ